MTKKQKDKKKKNREEIAKKRVLARRNNLRKNLSEKRKLDKLDKKFREKIKPIMNESKSKEIEDIKNKNIIAKLENNMKVLEALEKEYQEEIDHKKEVNDLLEAEGHVSIKQKMDALEEKMKNEIEKKSKV